MLLALAALLILAAPAFPREIKPREIKMQALVSPDGTGRLFLNTGYRPFSWEACAPDLTECKWFGGGDEIGTAGAPAGTVFRVKDFIGEHGVSPEWKGRLRQVAPPSVEGPIEANQFVSPVPGEWSGGWAGEGAEMQLSACETATGQGCTTLTDSHYMRQCPRDSSFPLDPRFAGEYLRVADNQPGAGPIAEPAFGLTSPYGGEGWVSNQATSTAVVGQIAPATGPPPGECGPPPAPRATISAEGIAKVECGGGCGVTLTGTRKGRRSAITREIPEQDLLKPEAAREMWLPPGMLARLGAGKIRLIVEVDGRRLSQRTIRAPES
jgi:hypothetical protein